MRTSPLDIGTGAAVWERVLQFGGALSPPVARAILKLKFSPQDEQRMRELSARARVGNLSPLEQSEMDAYEQLGSLLDIFHSQARRTVKRRKVAS
jgi:hypothetical protein